MASNMLSIFLTTCRFAHWRRKHSGRIADVMVMSHDMGTVPTSFDLIMTATQVTEGPSRASLLNYGL